MLRKLSWREKVLAEAEALRKSGHLTGNALPPSITKGLPAPPFLTAEQKVAWEIALEQYWAIEARCPNYFGDR